MLTSDAKQRSFVLALRANYIPAAVPVGLWDAFHAFQAQRQIHQAMQRQTAPKLLLERHRVRATSMTEMRRIPLLKYAMANDVESHRSI